MLARRLMKVISLVSPCTGLALALAGCAGPDAPVEPLAVRAAALEGVVAGRELAVPTILLDGFRNGQGAMVFSTPSSERLFVSVCDPANDPVATDPYGSLEPSIAPEGCGQTSVMVCGDDGSCVGFGEVEAVFTATSSGVHLEVDGLSGADAVHATIDFEER